MEFSKKEIEVESLPTTEMVIWEFDDLTVVALVAITGVIQFFGNGIDEEQHRFLNHILIDIEEVVIYNETGSITETYSEQEIAEIKSNIKKSIQVL